MNAESSLGIDRVRGSERIASLDVIRGLAILFILYMNIQGMGGYDFQLRDFRYPTWTTADFWSVYGIQVYMSGTQRGLLELLFGAGIMIMARKAMEPDGPVAVADLHYRRNLWLCAFGLLNAFVLMWWGDILLTYGIAATFLFPFRRLKPLTQCAIGAAFIGILVAYAAVEYQGRAERFETAARVTAQQAAHQKVRQESLPSRRRTRRLLLKTRRFSTSSSSGCTASLPRRPTTKRRRRRSPRRTRPIIRHSALTGALSSKAGSS